jgi:hypothetical protein
MEMEWSAQQICCMHRRCRGRGWGWATATVTVIVMRIVQKAVSSVDTMHNSV